MTQTLWGIGDVGFEAAIRDEAGRCWPADAKPRIDIVQADFPHNPLPPLEFLALIGR